MKSLKLLVLITFYATGLLFFSGSIKAQNVPVNSMKVEIGHFTLFVPEGWNVFSKDDRIKARKEFELDLEPGLKQYEVDGKPKPRMGDFRVFQKQPFGQLIGWTLIVPDNTNLLQKIFKKENQFRQRKDQIKSGSCRLVKIDGIDVVRVDVEMTNGDLMTNLHFYSPKSPGIISSLMFGLRSGKSVQAEKEFESIIGSIKIKEVVSFIQASFGVDSDEVIKNLKSSEDFLMVNKGRDGVITTASGLQYEIIKAGTGLIPKAESIVKCNYIGSTIDGNVFDNSIERGEPSIFPVNKLITGWTEALQLMPVGSKWKLFIPADLAYKERAHEPYIKPYSALIFEVELIEIVKK